MTELEMVNNHPDAALIAYLIGVPQVKIPEDDYNFFCKDETRKKVRQLCQIRTQILRNFQAVNLDYKKGRYFDAIPATAEPYRRLAELGVKLERQASLSKEIISINYWIFGFAEYAVSIAHSRKTRLRELLVMPQGDSIDGVRKAVKAYSDDKDHYPFQMYLNIPLSLLPEQYRSVYILRNDDIFEATLNALYQPEMQSGAAIKFFSEHNAAMIVDTENIDPVRLYEMVKSASHTIKKIILVKDENTSEIWAHFEMFANQMGIVCEVESIERINRSKSYVDFIVQGKAMKEYYQNGTNALAIASSDCDYWALLKQLPDAAFAVIIEKDKANDQYIAKLANEKIPVWLLDGYDTENSELVRAAADMYGRSLICSNAIDLNRIVNMVAERLKLYPYISVLHELKKDWLDAAEIEKVGDTIVFRFNTKPKAPKPESEGKEVEDEINEEIPIQNDTETMTDKAETKVSFHQRPVYSMPAQKKPGAKKKTKK